MNSTENSGVEILWKGTVSGNSLETMRELCLSTNFPHPRRLDEIVVFYAVKGFRIVSLRLFLTSSFWKNNFSEANPLEILV